jgi:hypothetical protein
VKEDFTGTKAIDMIEKGIHHGHGLGEIQALPLNMVPFQLSCTKA